MVLPRLAFALVATVLTAVACGTPAEEEEAADEESAALTQMIPIGTRVVTTTRVHLREASSKSSRSLGVLDTGTEATIIQAMPEGPFYRIRLDNGASGYSHGDYLRVLGDAGAEAGVALEGGTASEFPTSGDIFQAEATAYYPDNSELEGGFLDRRGAKLRTLQQFLAGQAEYVSVAMDSEAFPYGQQIRIKELEQKYRRAIDFRVVDTGGAFASQGRYRLDICVHNYSASIDSSVNGTVTIAVVR